MNYFSRLKFVGLMLLALPLAFSSCKDTDEDALNEIRISNLKQLAELQNQLGDLAQKISALEQSGQTPSVSIDPVTKHWIINGEDTGIVAEGQDGQSGATPNISIDPETKHWLVNGEDTGILAEAQVNYPTIDPVTKHWIINGVDTGIVAEGKNGQDGTTPEVNITIDPVTKHWIVNGVDTGVVAEGQNGTTPTVSIVIDPTTKHWIVNGEDTGVVAEGQNGMTPTISIDPETKNWVINGADTGIKAEGMDGTTPTISIDPDTKNWIINGVDTGIKAEGKDGQDGASGSGSGSNIVRIDPVTKHWIINGIDTGIVAEGKNGADGANGKSAFEIALAGGFIGTQAEWLESLKGANGTNAPVISAINIIGDQLIFSFSDGSMKSVTLPGISGGSGGSESYNHEDLEYAAKIAKEVAEAFFGTSEGLTDAQIATLSDKIKGALTKLETYINNLKERATSISVEGVHNQVFGMIKSGLGVQTNMLMGFYGSIEKGYKFPTTSVAYYANTDVILNTEYVDLNTERVRAEDIYPEKLGTAYITINPAQVDFTGVDVNLSNTQGQSNGIVMSNIRKSDKVLKMGYTPTRAAAGTGFYEVDAMVDDAEAVEKIEIDVNEILDIAKSAKDAEGTISSMASALQTVTRAFSTQAYALKIEQSDDLATADGVKHTVNSPYNIQAALLRPVGYQATDMLPSSLPGYNKVINLTNSVINRLVKKLQNNSDLIRFQQTLENLTDIEQIHFSIEPGQGNLIDTTFYVNIDITMEKPIEVTVPINTSTTIEVKDTIQVKDGSGNVIGEGEVNLSKPVEINDTVTVRDTISITYHDVKEITFTISQSALADLYQSLNNEVNDAIAPINDMLESVNSAVSQGLSLIRKMRDPSLAGTIQDEVTSIIDRVWNKLDAIYSSIESRFELAMLLNAGGKTSIVGQGLNNPTVVNATSFTAVLTNFNGEILVPAYKKHLCVTNAWGVADKRGACDAVNASINKVIPGSQQKLNVSGLKSGVTYEFSYSGLDYSGKQLTRKYYVKCK